MKSILRDLAFLGLVASQVSAADKPNLRLLVASRPGRDQLIGRCPRTRPGHPKSSLPTLNEKMHAR